MATDSLKRKTAKALFWSFVEVLGLRGVQFVIGVLLARILLPEQFGLIGMLTIFIALIQLFLDSGFGPALIQKRDATQADMSSVFYFNIGVGLVGAALLCLVAPWIAAFYGQPILTPVTRALSLTIVINSFGLIQTTLLNKQIDFKPLTKVSFVASLLSGLIGVSCAIGGLGVWSLVVQQVSSATIRTLLLWLVNAWRPTLVFSTASLKEMFGFSSRLLVVGLISTITQNLYLIIIGKLFSPASLGFYSRAKTLAELPGHTVSDIAKRVAFPVFSTIQDEQTRLKRGSQKALTTLVSVVFPMLFGLAATAKPLVLVLLTDRWAPCVPYLQLLCIVCLIYPLHIINLNILMVKGRSDLYWRIEAIKPVLIALSLVLTYRWGITAILYGQVVVSCLCFYLNGYYTRALIDYSLAEQLSDVVPYLAASVFMGLGTWSLQWVPFPNALSLLSCQILVGVSLYGVFSYIFKPSALVESLSLVRDHLKPALLDKVLARSGD